MQSHIIVNKVIYISNTPCSSLGRLQLYIEFNKNNVFIKLGKAVRIINDQKQHNNSLA